VLEFAGPEMIKEIRAQMILNGGHTCGGCSEVWTGLGRSHCGKCHRTFTTSNVFDQHRAINEQTSDHYCLNPESLDMISRDDIWRNKPSETFSWDEYNKE